MRWVLLLAAFSASVLVLAAYARMRIHSPQRGRIEAIITDARQRANGYTEEVRLAREKLPPDAGIAKDWDFRRRLETTFSNAWWKYLLAENLLDTPRKIRGETVRAILRAHSSRGPLPPFLQSADPEKGLSEADCTKVRCFFRDLPELKEIEKGFAYGLCGDTYSLGWLYPAVTTCFAARAICESIDGETQKALDTCLLAYGLAMLSARGFHAWAYNVSDSMRSIDRALWRVADAPEFSDDDWERVLAEIDRRRTVKPLIDTLRIDAACQESGLTPDLAKRSDQVGSTLEVLLSGGAMQIADEFVGKLDRPSYECGLTQRDLTEAEKALGHFTLPLQAFRCACTRACVGHAYSVARADAARLARVLKAWKKAHGAYPKTLDAMDPKAPEADLRDPDTGKPVQYELHDDGFRLSVSRYDVEPVEAVLWKAAN